MLFKLAFEMMGGGAPTVTFDQVCVFYGRICTGALVAIDDGNHPDTAIEKLLAVIRSVEDPKPLVPHLKGLVRLVGPLLDDPNFKIALTSIQITGELVDKAGVDMALQADNVLPLLVEKFGDKKIVIRQGTMKVDPQAHARDP